MDKQWGFLDRSTIFYQFKPKQKKDRENSPSFFFVLEN